MKPEEYYDRMFMKECLILINKHCYEECDFIHYRHRTKEYRIYWWSDMATIKWNICYDAARILEKQMTWLFGWPWSDSYTEEHFKRDKEDSIKMCYFEKRVAVDYFLWNWAYDRCLELIEKYGGKNQN